MSKTNGLDLLSKGIAFVKLCPDEETLGAKFDGVVVTAHSAVVGTFAFALTLCVADGEADGINGDGEVIVGVDVDPVTVAFVATVAAAVFTAPVVVCGSETKKGFG